MTSFTETPYFAPCCACLTVVDLSALSTKAWDKYILCESCFLQRLKAKFVGVEPPEDGGREYSETPT